MPWVKVGHETRPTVDEAVVMCVLAHWLTFPTGLGYLAFMGDPEGK